MVAEASVWRWSSYRALVGRDPAPTWLESDWVLGQFGTKRQEAQSLGHCA